MLDAAIILTIIAVGLYFAIRFAKTRLEINSTILHVDIRNHQYRIFTPIAKLPYQAQHYEFEAAEFIQRVELDKQCLYPVLKIQWPSFIAKNKVLQTSVTVPLETRIGPINAHKLRKILQGEFDLLIFTRNTFENKLQLLPLKNSTWRQVNDNTTGEENEAVNHIRPPPYV